MADFLFSFNLLFFRFY